MPDHLTVLAVDDEPNNLRALKLDLEDGGYEVLCAQDGVEGWEMLQQHRKRIKVVLLDRMMPRMDGMEFLKTLQSSDLARVPVIMQTAAAEKEQVLQGIKAGVYYYLTKPYDKDILLSIVSAAIEDYGHYSRLKSNLEQFRSKVHLIRDSQFEVRTLEDAEYLATFLSQFFPVPERVVMGISELLINAIEHGNLGITYHEKTALNKQGTWQEEIRRRIVMPEYASKKAHVAYLRSEDAITLTIRDEGSGFAWEEYLTISPERATDNHGRGIALSKLMCFDNMDYQGNGNTVICTVRLDEAA